MKYYSFITFIFITIISLMSCTKGSEGSEAGAEQASAPKIVSISSKYNGKAVYGYPIVIKGKNFSTQPGGNVVVFGNETVKELIDFFST